MADDGIRAIWVGRQSAFGTAATFLRKAKCVNFSFTPKANTYTPQEYGGGLTVDFDVVRGTRHAEFDLTVGMRYIEVGHFLVGGMGLPTTTVLGSNIGQVQTILGGTAVSPTNATVGITFDGYTATASASAIAATWDTAIKALPSIKGNAVTVTGGALTTTAALTITFGTGFTGAHFPAMTVTQSALTAGTIGAPAIGTAGVGAYQHVYKMGGSNRPYLTLIEYDGVSYKVYKDVALSDFDISYGLDDYVKLHCSGISSFEGDFATAALAGASGVLSNAAYVNQPIDGTSLGITHLGTAYRLAKSGSIKVANGRQAIHAINAPAGDVGNLVRASEGFQHTTFDMMTRYDAQASLSTTLTNIVTASGTAQSVLVGSSVGMVVGMVVVVARGTVRQQNVTVTALADTTHFTGVFTITTVAGDTAEVPSNYLAYIANASPTSLVLAGTSTSTIGSLGSAVSATISMGNPRFTEGKRDPMDGSNEAVVNMTGAALYNTADDSPLVLTLVNGQPSYDM